MSLPLLLLLLLLLLPLLLLLLLLLLYPRLNSLKSLLLMLRACLRCLRLGPLVGPFAKRGTTGVGAECFEPGDIRIAAHVKLEQVGAQGLEEGNARGPCRPPHVAACDHKNPQRLPPVNTNEPRIYAWTTAEAETVFGNGKPRQGSIRTGRQ